MSDIGRMVILPPPDQNEPNTRIRYVKLITTTSLCLTMVVIIVTAFSLQSDANQRVINEEIRSTRDLSKPVIYRHARPEDRLMTTTIELEQFGKNLGTVHQVVLVSVIYALLVHLALLWGVVIEQRYVVIPCAVLLTFGVAVMIVVWIPSSIYTTAFIFELVLTILASVMSYLLHKFYKNNHNRS